jgi:hypothetical protein
MPEPTRPSRPTQPSRASRRSTPQIVANELVLEFEEAKIEDEKNAPKPLPPPARGLTQFVIAVVLVMAAVATWITAWFNLQPDRQRSSMTCREQRLAELRLRIAAQARGVEQYARLHGDLPGTLGATGDPLQGVGYVPRPDGEYELVARDGNVILTYRSTMRMEDFVGDAVTVLSQKCVR